MRAPMLGSSDREPPLWKITLICAAGGPGGLGRGDGLRGGTTIETGAPQGRHALGMLPGQDSSMATSSQRVIQARAGSQTKMILTFLAILRA